jgi:NADPH:quinone reductase-like Zn-dependent oxidoreductase
MGKEFKPTDLAGRVAAGKCTLLVTTQMKAIVYDKYGSPEVLRLEEVDKPNVPDDGVLVRVRAASVNPADWHYMRGEPLIARLAFGLRKPKQRFLGVDLAGVVEAVGKDVTQLHAGDEVFGTGQGALGEYVCTSQANLAAKPAALTFEQAAAVPVAGFTALQGLRDQGHIQPGQKVLINGASGGVGTFAVQIAKAFGASVTAVCSSRNVDLVRSLGADRVIDYTQADFTHGEERYDLILDVAGSRAWSELKRVLEPRATVVVVGGPSTSRWLGPVSHLIKVRLASLGDSRKAVNFLASVNQQDLVVLQELLEAGKVTPVVDRTYSLSETPEAVGYLEGGHARGKVVITV